MKTKIALTIIALCTLSVACSGCSVSRSSRQVIEMSRSIDGVSYHTLGSIVGHSIVISKSVDLGGKQCFLPEGYTLEFKGGIIMNGILIGNGTKLEHGNEAIFDHITIDGSWNVPEISSKMFKDLKYDNAIRNVVALASPSVHNKIVIEKGDYPVSVQRESETCLLIESNTELFLKGKVNLKPNALKGYYILKLEGENITISGGGVINGDKSGHQGNEGEWGMGIGITEAKNASVKDISVKDCWGDCVYVGKSSKNILIEDCYFDNGRRNGISVTDANGVTIRNCKISNVRGTNPQDAIDIEPNSNCMVDNILIDGVEVLNCYGGIIVSKGSNHIRDKRIGKFKIVNCKISTSNKYPIRVKYCEQAIIEGNTLYSNNFNSTVCINDTPDVIVRNNNIIKSDSAQLSKSFNINKAAHRKGKAPIVIIGAKRQEVAGNSLIQ